MTTSFTFLTFNILANRFTNFNKLDKINETKDEMQERYNGVIMHLEQQNKDICFLQEVDNNFYYALMDTVFAKKYYISHRYCKAYKAERNKDDIGQLIMVRNSKFKIPLELNKTFDNKYPANSHLLRVRGGHSSVFDFIKLTKNGVEGNQRKFSQILIINDLYGRYLILSNMHLEGNPDYQKLKEQEFEETYKACDEFKNKHMNMKNVKSVNMMFAGDFNEPYQNIVENIMIGDKPLRLINSDSKQLTSFSKFFTDKKTNERKMIDKQEKLDYLICSKELENSIDDMHIYPDFEIKNMPNWEEPFIDNDKNWVSDHKFLTFKFNLLDTHTKNITHHKKYNNNRRKSKKHSKNGQNKRSKRNNSKKKK
jgi:hypothetical protein